MFVRMTVPRIFSRFAVPKNPFVRALTVGLLTLKAKISPVRDKNFWVTSTVLGDPKVYP